MKTIFIAAPVSLHRQQITGPSIQTQTAVFAPLECQLITNNKMYKDNIYFQLAGGQISCRSGM